MMNAATKGRPEKLLVPVGMGVGGGGGERKERG